MALFGSPITRFFIWERISRSWGIGRVERVFEMASGHVRPGGTSTPGGSGGRPLDIGGGGAYPFGGRGG